MKRFLLCCSLLLSSIAYADVAPEEPAEEPSEEPTSEPTDDNEDSSEDDDEKSEDTGCSTISPLDISAMLLPVLCLGAAVILRKE